MGQLLQGAGQPPESPAKEQPGEVAAMVRRLRAMRQTTTSIGPIPVEVAEEAAALLEKLGQGWVPVSERLPEDEVDVLANTADGRDICFILRGEWVYGSSPGT